MTLSDLSKTLLLDDRDTSHMRGMEEEISEMKEGILQKGENK